MYIVWQSLSCNEQKSDVSKNAFAITDDLLGPVY